MQFLSRVLIAALLTAGTSHAQEAATAPPPPTSTEPTESAPMQKPYYVSPENMLTRCKTRAFLKCMKWDESECVAAITKATAEGNAEVEAEAASKPETETDNAFFKGYAMGIVLGHVQDASKGKLLGCIQAGKT